MTDTGPKCPFGFASRRKFLAAAGGIVAAASAGFGAGEIVRARKYSHSAHVDTDSAEPFYGKNQAGIVTPMQRHTYFAVFDLMAKTRKDVTDLLRSWTEAAAKLTQGQPVAALDPKATGPALDSGEVLGMSPQRLTLTFGFGPGLFSKDGQDRYGLSDRRPAPLVDLPRFNGDEIIEPRSAGDLSVQACAEDPQIAFHAVRQLARLAEGVAQLRWTQTGFVPDAKNDETSRNVMGFRDGTESPLVDTVPEGVNLMDDAIWVGGAGPDWMRGGTYMVTRRIRIALEHWDKTDLDFQEQVIGRHKYSGAPLTGQDEFDRLKLDALDPDGNPIIPENAHVRLANAASNDGAHILRRGYSYNDGVNITAERWPPWRQGLEYDVGLLFMCYQQDPRTGFVKIYDQLSKFDMLNQYTTHTGTGIFAIPGGIAPGNWIGQGLLA